MSSALRHVVDQIHAEWILAGRRVFSFRENLEELFLLVRDRKDPRIAAISDIKDPNWNYFENSMRYELIMAGKHSGDPKLFYITETDVIVEIFGGEKINLDHIEDFREGER